MAISYDNLNQLKLTATNNDWNHYIVMNFHCSEIIECYLTDSLNSYAALIASKFWSITHYIHGCVEEKNWRKIDDKFTVT
jgi:hypothetical protein